MFDTTGAPCSQVDPELFFRESEMGRYDKKTIYSLCSNCPVFVKCSEYSLEYDVWGYWAGRSRYERKKIQKQLNIKPKNINLEIKQHMKEDKSGTT